MDYNIEDLVKSIDFTKNQLQDCGNGLYLTNFEIDTLNKYNIDYKKYNELKSILFELEIILNDNLDLDDLEQVSKSIAERDYYMNSHK